MTEIFSPNSVHRPSVWTGGGGGGESGGGGGRGGDDEGGDPADCGGDNTIVHTLH